MNLALACVAEMIGTAGTAAVAIGFSLSAGVLPGGPISGGAGNPARALGPMLVSGTFPLSLVYTVGPLIGTVVAAGAFRLVGAASAPSVPHPSDTTTDGPLAAPHAAFIGEAPRRTGT